MDSQGLIDAQFDRAVEIVQGLPKTGPIQTGYEEKLTMYSLYKQATVGNVESPRPGIWDMLGRAKWDAWAKHKDLDPFEAKWLYVDALLKVLRKYSEKTVARDFVQELESFGGDPSNLVLSHTLSKSRGSNSSGSTASRNSIPGQYSQEPLPSSSQHIQDATAGNESSGESSSNESEDEAPELPAAHDQSQPIRPQSSVSSHRYRTPVARSLLMSPPPMHGSIPAMQPLPSFETQSAFAEPLSNSIPPTLNPPSDPYAGRYPSPSRGMATPNIHHTHVNVRPPTASIPPPPRQYGIPTRPASRPTLEYAIENVQIHLASIAERLDVLEAAPTQPRRSNLSLSTKGSVSPWRRGSPHNIGNDNLELEWDIDDMGLWSLILNPLSRVAVSFRQLAAFFAHNENRSPVLIIVRRLCLDISFIIAMLAIIRTFWRRTHARRQEVNAALVVLWRAITGSKQGRVLAQRGL